MLLYLLLLSSILFSILQYCRDGFLFLREILFADDEGTFIGMSRATPEKFQFSIKVPETITHVKKMDVNQGAIAFFEEFLDKISPLRTANKLGAILFQLPPSFTVHDFKNIEEFLDKLPTNNSYDYAMEFRHPSWATEGTWEMLKQL